MTFNINKHKSDLLFMPIGGTNEIGMNLNLYHYKGKILIVDIGIGFADHHYPGVDLLVPDISFIRKHLDKVCGIVITHAHEDHVGALQYLWHEIGCPIYTTKFTASIIRTKFAESKISTKNLKIIEIQDEERFDIGSFCLETVEITHSVPEMRALLLRTEFGNILHTGDWKFDDQPVIGNNTNYKKLAALGESGVLAMICDSTNIFQYKPSKTEGALQDSLTKLVQSRVKGLVIITTFASNIARMYSIAKAAEAAGRKVILVGRSLWRMYEAAKESGYLLDIPEMLTEVHIKNYSRKEILIMATGCQGERFAAINKMANDKYFPMELLADDTVIFSSKIIPGNEKRIYSLINKLYCKQVEVITEETDFVHVSGHPSRQDIKKMYEMVKPRIVIPVHGEAMHIVEHTKFAKSCGIKESVAPMNGNVIKIDADGVENIGHVESGYYAIDGNYIISTDSDILTMRRKMQDSGIFIIVLYLDKQYNCQSSPVLLAPGLLDMQEDKEIIEMITVDIVEMMVQIKNKNSNIIRQRAKLVARKIIKHETGKQPHIIVHLVEANAHKNWN